MTILADLAMIAFFPAVLLLFMLLPPRRAVLGALLVSTLLLPMVSYQFQGFPAYNKLTAASLAILLGIVIFDSNRLTSFRPRLLDLPMVVFCFTPFFSSITNGLGEYDGISATVEQILTWGVPYFVGRVYFGDRESLGDLAGALVIGGLIYVPLCLWEIRMSPQLHATFYGHHQHDFLQTMRFGGWRPTVFMQHGLAVAMFMTSASLVAVWMWYTGALRRILGIPMTVLVPPLLLTTVLCKSLGALVLLGAGLVALFVAAALKARFLLVLLLIPPVLYMGVRTVGGWSAHDLVQMAEMVDEHRAGSLETRIYHENLLIDRALEQPVFGWGRWGRNRVVDEQGQQQSITDGLWIIVMGTMGVTGLVALYGWLLIPPWEVFRRVATLGAATAAPVSLGVVLALYASDAVLNAMVNQFWPLIAGALVGAVAVSARARRMRGRRTTIKGGSGS